MRRIALLSGVVAAIGLALALAFTLDQRAHAGRVARNVELHGKPIGGIAPEQLATEIRGLAQRMGGTTLSVRAADGSGDDPSPMTFQAREIGLALDEERTLESVMSAGRQSNLAARLFSWALSPVRKRDAGVAVSANHDAIYALISERDAGREPPTEPTIRGEEEAVQVVPGKPGKGVDAADVIRGLPDAARTGLPLKVAVERGGVPPRHSLAEARKAAALAERLVSGPLTLRAAGETRTVPIATARSWLETSAAAAYLQVTFDDTKTIESLQSIFEGLGREPVDARFVVEGGQLKLIPGRDGTKCCDAGAVDVIESQVLNRDPSSGLPDDVGPLPLAPVAPKRGIAELRGLNIVEQVATFTTPHKPGEPRVRNIHRISDLMRGQIIGPGETLSVNDIVGKRTAERGFVSAPVIQDGNFGEGIGGGVSQFATTLFNAAFLTGLEFPEYQSHSIYISRYPYGREATLSYPRPDLKIRNPTPHGVLIWATYTETSITVSLWSTKYFRAEQTGQTKSARGPCTLVRTERTRTAPDGTKKVDHVNALYRPGEGVQC
ncbi:MAG TPA: VanW family protein [Acidimicrobiales bacterium]|nr:VanW family protein [Acidimicrobiales bacterium]